MGNKLMNKIFDYIKSHFFTPGSLKELAVIRIVVVSVQLFFLLTATEYSLKANPGSNLEFQQWLTTIEDSEYKPTLILKIFLTPFGIDRPGFEFIEIIWWITVIAGFFSLLGFFTNYSLLLLSFGTTFLIGHFYSYQEYHHTESVLVIFLWILAFSRCGYLYSIDYLLKEKRRKEIFENNYYDEYARWPVKTMQIIFAIVYFSAGFEKITKGIDWMNGYTLAYGIVQDGLYRDLSLGIFLSSNIPLMIFLSMFTIIFELFFFIIIIKPKLTWIFLLLGAGFHLSVFILHGPPFIQYIILYIAFIEPIRQTIKSRSFFKLKLNTT